MPEAAPGPVASALTPAAAEAEETRAVHETREEAVVAVEATDRTELDQETRSPGPPEAVDPEAGHAPPPRVAVIFGGMIQHATSLIFWASMHDM